MYGRGRAKGVFSPSLAVTHSTSAQPWATDPPEPTGTVARLSKTPHSSPLRETAPSSSSSLRVVDPVPTTAVRPSNTSPSGGRDASTHAVVDDLVTAAKSHLQHLESDYKELESILARHRREDALHREEVSDDHDERDVRPIQTRRRPADEATAVSFYHNSTAPTPFQAPHQQQQQQPPTIRPRSAAAAHTSSDAAEIRARQLEDARRDAALSALERQLLNTERRLADCQQALEGRTAELRSANAKVRGLSQQLSELRDSNGLLTAEVAALQSTIENERRTTATRRHEIAASGDEARKLRIDLHECRLENAALREEVERLRDKVHTQQEVLRAHAQNPPASAAAATAANYSDGAPPQPATNRSAPPSGTTSASAAAAPLQGGGNPPTATATAATRVIIIGGSDKPSSSAPLPPPAPAAPAAAAPPPPTPVVAAPPIVTSNSRGHDTVAVAVAPRAVEAADDRASYTTVDGGHDDAADTGMDQPPPRRDTSIVRHLFAHQPSAVASHEPSPVRVVTTTSSSGVERDPAHQHKAMSSSSSRQLPISYEGHMPWTRRDVVGAPSSTTTTTAATQRAV